MDGSTKPATKPTAKYFTPVFCFFLISVVIILIASIDIRISKQKETKTMQDKFENSAQKALKESSVYTKDETTGLCYLVVYGCKNCPDDIVAVANVPCTKGVEKKAKK